eukprot:2734002-Pleurochrysis_carterae.AAC.5
MIWKANRLQWENSQAGLSVPRKMHSAKKPFDILVRRVLIFPCGKYSVNANPGELLGHASTGARFHMRPRDGDETAANDAGACARRLMENWVQPSDSPCTPW